MKTPMSSLFQYKIKTFWKQQTANPTANSKQQQHVFSHLFVFGNKVVISLIVRINLYIKYTK